MNDTNRAEFEAWLKTKPDARFWNTTDAMFAAWIGAISGGINSQLDENTLKKMAFLRESKSMRLVGVVMLDDATGQRATVDMGRVTWTGQNTERVALSDPTLPNMPPPIVKHQKLGGLFDRMQMHCYAVKYGDGLTNLLLAAQADAQKHATLPETPICTKSQTSPITQPLIAEAARDDACWCNSDRPWNEYPVGTKARESWSAGFWLKTEHGWKWPLGSTFPTPGGSDQVLFAAVKRDGAAGDARDDSFMRLVDDAKIEAKNAMHKFPQPNYVITKIAEEAGEVVKAAVHFAEGRETAESVRGEMKQAIAMLYRLWKEGDQVHGCPSIDAAIAASKEATDWGPITAPGQVKVGTKLRFTIGDEKFSETAKQILHPGTDKEEIIYNKRKNYYLITSMAIQNRGSQKNVEFFAAIAASMKDANHANQT